jgi:threo-3-hydroxy-L-aspartate ammonia-lyase
MAGPVAYDDIRSAAERIRAWSAETPVHEISAIQIGRQPLLVKREDLQLSGSFKVRGVANFLLSSECKLAVAGSSGNHGIALAEVCSRLDSKALVVMMRGSSVHKRQRIVSLGATVVECSQDMIIRKETTASLAGEWGGTVVDSSDDERIIAGQGTIGLEIARQVPDVRTILVPLGGGGLLAGVLLAIRRMLPKAQVFGVEPACGNDFKLSIEAGRPVTIDQCRTICDGALARTPGQLTFPLVQRLVDDILLVGDKEVASTVALLRPSGLALEPTGALGIAAARLHAAQLRPPVLAVASGGNIM